MCSERYSNKTIAKSAATQIALLRINTDIFLARFVGACTYE